MELLRDMLSFYLSYIGPVLDVLLLAFLMYKSYQILIKTQAAQLGKGALLMLLIYAVAFLLHLTTMLWILNMLATGVVIGDYLSARTAKNVPDDGAKRLVQAFPFPA